MMRFLRSQSQTVLIVILGVLGLSFLFYGNVGNLLTPSTGRPSDTGRIDGEEVSVADMIAEVRSTRDAMALQGHELDPTQPGAGAEIAQAAWGQLLTLREAERLHIDVTDQELLDYIQSRPYFQKNGVYSPDIYQTIMTNLQNVRRITPDRYERFVRDLLRADGVRKALFSTARRSSLDLEAEFEKYEGPVQMSMIRFDPKTYVTSNTISPQDIEAQYKAHPENPFYRTPEKRKVDYALFLLTSDQNKLPDKDKEAAMEALGQKALDFALAFQPDPSATPASAPAPPDFVTEAKKRGLMTATTDFFAPGATPAGVPPSPNFNTAAFALTREDPISKVTLLENGVAILHLVEVQPSELRPLTEVSAGIALQVQAAKGREAAEAAAQNAAQKLQAKSGADFKTAAAALGLKVEAVPSFVPVKVSSHDQLSRIIASTSVGMKEGEISPPLPGLQGEFLIIRLDSRGKPDPAGLAAFQEHYSQSKDQQLRDEVYGDWVDWKSRQPGTHRPANLNDYGSVE